jgi:methionyl aminopeptidase
MARRYIVYDNEDVNLIRQAANKAAVCLQKVCNEVGAGITTQALDDMAGDIIESEGCVSAFRGYMGFPANVCISVNNEVIHGLGGQRTIESGDIVSVDCGVHYNGFIGDNAKTVPVGDINEQAERLLATTQKCLAAAIKAARCGNLLNEIGASVEAMAKESGFTVVLPFTGHGVGRKLHEPPQVPNYANDSDIKLHPGMVLAIEPMINAGGASVSLTEDGWTVTTTDGELSAHFEHTILITEHEAEILTWVEE